MTTNHAWRVREEHGNIIVLCHEPQEETETEKLSLRQRFLQWFGRLVMLALGAAAFFPNTLHLSAGARPWIFVTLILWIFAYCTGIFNP